MKQLLKDLTNFVYPRICPGCKKPLVTGESGICLSCVHDLEFTDHELTPTENDLFYRIAGRVPLHGAAALYHYDKKSKLQKAIQALKYNHFAEVGKQLGKLLGHKLAETPFIPGDAVLVPVPLHPVREAERGYNQAELIARGMAEITGHTVRTDLLVRKVKTNTQTKKDREDRWKNVENKFSVKEGFDGHVAIVDDIVTTGSTIESCIRAFYDQHPQPASMRVISAGMTRKQS